MDYLKKYATHLLLVVTVAAAGSAYYFYNEASALKKDPNKVAKEESSRLVSQVSKLIVLPAGETPTIATVADPEKLKEQAFFANAAKGDKVLIYAQARKAVLYSPIFNKIIEVAPINIGNKNQ